MHSQDPRVRPPLVFNRAEFEADWDKAADSNQRLRAMYDDMLDFVAKKYPGGSLIDIACNNGYFPVGAERRGMKGFGLDLGSHYAKSVEFLNSVLGTDATFLNASYDSRSHAFTADLPKCDVAVMSAIMCHIPDPLNFLSATTKLANKAFLFWGQVLDSDDNIVCYNPPHEELSSLRDFPFSFNDNTRISRGMFKTSLNILGFDVIEEIGPHDTWLSLNGAVPWGLEEEFKKGSRHITFLASRS